MYLIIVGCLTECNSNINAKERELLQRNIKVHYQVTGLCIKPPANTAEMGVNLIVARKPDNYTNSHRVEKSSLNSLENKELA
jgi:hypothetical protein